MSHLTERLAEFVFGELSAAEIAQANRHLAQCAECRIQVEQFQHTHAMLKASPDVEPPRRIIFEVEKRSVAPWVWRWLGPMAASAAVALLVVSVAPRPQPQVIDRVVQQPAGQPSTQPAAQPVDYQKIVNELRISQEAWLESELRKRDAAHRREIQSVRGDLLQLDAYQQALYRNNAENQASIQLLAQRTDSRE